MKINPLAYAVCAALTAFAPSVFAQSAQNTQTEEESIEVINVTGSLIKGVDVAGAQPLTVITAEDIAKTGANTIADLMRTISQTRGGVGSFTTAQSGATSTSTPPGQAAASLRGVGPSSTLTLVNGRRIAASSFASGTENFVDINSIPASAIERIDILANGASATYGADAVAGVINYVLRDDYEGLELSANYENTFDSPDDGKVGFQVLWGTEVGDGNLTVFADYYDRQPSRAIDRALTRDPILQSNYSYLPKNTPNIYFFSARDGNEIGNPECATPLVTTEFGEQICAYYANQDDYLETPLETLSAGFSFVQEYEDLTWKTDVFYSHADSTSYSTPAPINQINDDEGPFVDESALFIFDEATQDELFDNLFIDPFFTQAGQRLFGFGYDARFSDPRTVEVETDSFRLVSALSGVIGDWDWESAVLLSRSESSQTAVAGIYNRYQYTAAADGELCSDGSIANYNPDTDTLSCAGGSLLPMYNPFLVGDDANDAVLAQAQARPTREGESTVYGWDIRASGDLMEFNDRMIRAAVGAEVRREEITDIPSEDSRARVENGYLVDVFGFGSSLSEADRTQYGAFAEFNVPLTEAVEMSLAGRFDDYNDFGSSFNPKVGLTYRPVEELVLRASWSTAFRAPSLTQAGVKLRTTRASFDCSANQAVADLYCEGDGSVRGNNVLELGNPALRAEESESISAGFVWSPTKNTDIKVDYWQFEHDDLVDTNMTGVLAAAINDASLRHCGLVPDGEIGISYDPAVCTVTDNNGLFIDEEGANLTEILEAFNETGISRFEEIPLFRDHVLLLDNTGTQDVSGIDFDFFHQIEFDSGNLELALNGTHYLKYERNKPGSDEIEELIGQFSYPETIATAEIFWDTEDWYVGAYVFYTDGYQDDIERLRGRNIDELNDLGVLDANEERDVSSWTTVRLSAGYYFENATLRFAVDNVFDRDPPVAYGSGRGYDSFNSNPYGAIYSVSVDYFF
ncbi:TonB-dependent receptor domain-containing protein [Alteromonas oceanisediminis]|uniref:TonB-dependent receptor domain-containing protein n=1 Tax=Alteromonas oceanisediminis TaxID=2836180 RepID=UPI001BD96C86|nr:TonB-dependent receptor [Alteromonas oceanisediminis]MBT0585634.1 TonB-dependent receptor [Alteromonas oceanisediminis]